MHAQGCEHAVEEELGVGDGVDEGSEMEQLAETELVARRRRCRVLLHRRHYRPFGSAGCSVYRTVTERRTHDRRRRANRADPGDLDPARGEAQRAERGDHRGRRRGDERARRQPRALVRGAHRHRDGVLRRCRPRRREPVARRPAAARSGWSGATARSRSSPRSRGTRSAAGWSWCSRATSSSRPPRRRSVSPR